MGASVCALLVSLISVIALTPLDCSGLGVSADGLYNTMRTHEGGEVFRAPRARDREGWDAVELDRRDLQGGWEASPPAEDRVGRRRPRAAGRPLHPVAAPLDGLSLT
ncbi:hypothetical protein GCM10022288_23630 [Gryllotalpicola kribbensis]|uniref:Uncharacterized protein n=1 Tax=Gryllotalpicola kribbensis TaxID=993084 RepID=A0ABP8AW51_9MICO